LPIMLNASLYVKQRHMFGFLEQRLYDHGHGRR
jgi:hypothetical protein